MNSSNSSVVLWQSFDHLTDTWLPGGKFGLNKITRLRHRLISWKNSEDPGLGAYSLQIEDDGTDRFFVMWNECRRYWNTGLWDGSKFRILGDQTALGYFGYITNDTYITNQYENSANFTDNSTIVRKVSTHSLPNIGTRVTGAEGVKGKSISPARLMALLLEEAKKSSCSFPMSNCLQILSL
ncbi:hypothetical protein ACLOJK_019648 [Asimina triloba]